jgi:uncharacterized protein DUF6491
MKPIAILLLAGLAGACAPQEPVEMSEADQSRLAEALAGRTPGPPVSCVSQRGLGSNRAIGDQAILFEATGDTVYVNRPAGGCPGLGFGRTLVIRTTISQLCRGDIVTVLDPVSGTEYGGCGLGDFIPYRRPP